MKATFRAKFQTKHQSFTPYQRRREKKQRFHFTFRFYSHPLAKLPVTSTFLAMTIHHVAVDEWPLLVSFSLRSYRTLSSLYGTILTELPDPTRPLLVLTEKSLMVHLTDIWPARSLVLFSFGEMFYSKIVTRGRWRIILNSLGDVLRN